MGYGERLYPLDGNSDPRFAMRGPAVKGEPKRPWNINPGVGEYTIDKKMGTYPYNEKRENLPLEQ